MTEHNLVGHRPGLRDEPQSHEAGEKPGHTTEHIDARRAVGVEYAAACQGTDGGSQLNGGNEDAAGGFGVLGHFAGDPC